ncbi:MULTISPECIES: type II secretion system minor pseudopilin GspK [unclassified Alcanivorax]|uniref:type II secretion system minor pseudopilin GspK n=1 Tax=unclassified Alcanivorax TaxID=2638842 RepID=UPI0008A02ADB|nr:MULTISPECIES: type II secretion system minor pseudopilin GspK [unclassified Alcanivorax]MBB10536.1 general secretion pathway protein GspK [Alcanivorax sp.]MEE3386745.1 type II secretion system minor pseudopilin GspK [Pseudomonadota bacterium]SEF61289.1 type II secretion system protein K (GspK) [Alcanivorax sp. DSM 26293]
MVLTRNAKQRGVALIIVLMLFAILATITLEIVFRQDRFLTRADNLLQWDKRYQYAMAAEVVAQQGLIDDLEDDRNNNAMVDDCVEEQWAVQLPPTPYEDAMLSASVQDLQGRFNLNWLITASGDEFIRNPRAIAQLTRLIEQTFPGEANASRLANEMADWLDSNNIVDSVEGAEDPEYRNRRTPNLPAAHESEMRALLSFRVADQPAEPQAWGLLTALPLGTTLNVNTAPPQVLDAVIGDMAGTAAVQAVLDARQEKPVTEISELMKLPPLDDLSADEKNDLASLLGVSSEYFQVMVDVEVDGQLSRLVSRLRRATGQGETTAVFSRQVSPLLTPLEPACNPFYNADGS